MGKIKTAVLGQYDSAKIIKRYKNRVDAEWLFDFGIKSNADLLSLDGVFFCGDFDKNLLNEFAGAEHLRISKNEEELFSELDFFFGFPKPLEIEHKFLVKMPDLNYVLSSLPCRAVKISQAYVQKDGNRFRVRCREIGENRVYIKTVKRQIDPLTRIEIEEEINREFYEESIRGAKLISKTRYMFVFGGKYFELDVFPFWNDKALMELEVKDKAEKFELPPFINVIADVSSDRSYRNSALCAKYGTAQK